MDVTSDYFEEGERRLREYELRCNVTINNWYALACKSTGEDIDDCVRLIVHLQEDMHRLGIAPKISSDDIIALYRKEIRRVQQLKMEKTDE